MRNPVPIEVLVSAHAALDAAVATIRVWHGEALGFIEEEMWELYWRNMPDVQRIIEARDDMAVILENRRREDAAWQGGLLK